MEQPASLDVKNNNEHQRELRGSGYRPHGGAHGANSKKEQKAVEKQERRQKRRLEKCRKKIELLRKSGETARDLIEKFFLIHKKYEHELSIILQEENDSTTAKEETLEKEPPPSVVRTEASSATGLPMFINGKKWSNIIQRSQTPVTIWYPVTVAEVSALILHAEDQKYKVRAVGRGYSASNITTTDNYLIDLCNLKRCPPPGEQFLSADEKELIRDGQNIETLFQVEAGATLDELNTSLSIADLAMTNLPHSHDITIAGAISTASHGTGRYLGCISDFVKSIVLVAAKGEIWRIEPTDGITDKEKFKKIHNAPNEKLYQNDDYFNSVCVSMGTMGVIVSVIFRVEKKYWLKEKVVSMNWKELTKYLQKGKLWNEKKPKNRCHIIINPYATHSNHNNTLVFYTKYISKDPGSDPTDKRKTFSTSIAPKLNNPYELTNSIFRLFPKNTPELFDFILKNSADRVYTDLSYKVMNMPFKDELYLSCYTIQIAFPVDPIDQLINQIDKLFVLIDYLKRDLGYLTFPITLTFVNKSTTFMAMSANSPVCFIEISCLKDTKNSLALIKRIEEELVKHGGICHWGLRFSACFKDKASQIFPKFGSWTVVFSRFNGTLETFFNSFTDDLFLEMKPAALPSTTSSANTPPASSSHHRNSHIYDTVGPFRDAKEYIKKGLVRYSPQDIQRDFPHIAKGSYGVVFKGKVPDIPLTIAIKDMDIVDSSVIDDWKKELTVMNKNQSPYVVEVYGYSNDRNVVTIIMEFMTRGDLFNLLHKKNHPLSLLERLRMARHCLLGLSLLHQHQVIHRDVKSLNILVSEDFACKLTDFGCAKLQSDRQILNTANSGTPLWMAPEVKKGMYTFSADIYSIGLVLYELFEKKLPNWDDTRKVVILPQTFKYQNIITPCLDMTPDKRPTAATMVKIFDQMIINIVEALKNSLPKPEQESLSKSGDGDSLENDLVGLYKYFLTKPALEVDQLILKFCGELASNPPVTISTAGH